MTPSMQHCRLAVGLLLLIGTVTATAAQSGRPAQERRVPAPANGQVEIDTYDGSVEVKGWDKHEVLVRAQLSSGGDELDVDQHGSRTEISVEVRNPRSARTALEVWVPRASEVRIDAMSAAITVVDVEGEIEVETVAGPLRIAGSPRKVDASSVSGKLVLELGTCERVEVETVSGALEIGGAVESLETSTVAGSQRLRLTRSSELDVSTFSGPIFLDLQPQPDARVAIESFSGPTELRLPADVSARIDVETSTGRVGNRLPHGKTVATKDRSLRSWVHGSGRVHLRIESFSGSVAVVPRTP